MKKTFLSQIKEVLFIRFIVYMVSFILVTSASITANADFVGTNGDDFISSQGTSQTVTKTITNSYTGESFSINDTYKLNNSIYDGLAGFDILSMSSVNDALFLENNSGNQTVFNIEIIVAGNGNDIIDLSSTIYSIGSIQVAGGGGSDILWGNDGNDFISGSKGMDIINGGSGNDRLRGDQGNDSIYFGYGNDWDTIEGGSEFDEIVFAPGITASDLVITDLGGLSYDILLGNQGDRITATTTEQLRFSDGQTIDLVNFTYVPLAVPEPSLELLLGISLVGLVGVGVVRKVKQKKVANS